ncbi:MAG: GNAT family N-acetyltransferase [Caldilineaceae bacterium]
MSTKIVAAEIADIDVITTLVNRFAAQNVMLPRTRESVEASLTDWLVAVDTEIAARRVVGCGSLVPLTDELVEVRSLAIDESQQGKGLGGEIVLALVALAREQGFKQVCALTLRENFFIRLGFELVDRWSISPKVWQACIYCPKFHRCDEVAVLMHLAPQTAKPADANQPAAWNKLLKWKEWQPLKLAYQQKQTIRFEDEIITSQPRPQNGKGQN